MSAPHRHRHPVRRFVRRTLPIVVALAVTATLAAALQVHEVRVTGARRFPARDVEAVLHSALGTPTIATRASALRERVRTVPWVADATVRVSLDGVVACEVIEREPAAIAFDDGVYRLVDHEGRILATANPGPALLRLEGFAQFPEEREAFLAARLLLEQSWGTTIERAQRLGPHDVAIEFAGTATPVLADPARPADLIAARRVLAAWTARHSTPIRLDARVAGRVAVTPAPAAPEGES